MATSENRPSHFLREIIEKHLADGTYDGRVTMRFPPEPNGYPHLGHAKSIVLNFGLAEEYGGTCYLRYDDTNPDTESPEYVAAIEDAVRWLGYSPAEIRFTSDYFGQLYEWAVRLVEKGLAYVDEQTEDEIRATRGTVTEPGSPSPYRNRPVEENLRLLDEMRRGEHPDGSLVLRARIDMAHPNMKLRDPLMYRIRRDAHHYRTGNEWKIYPLYDWAHGQSDAIEDITHSFCTLEFDVNRPLYDWYLDAIGIPEPRNHQYEFARLNLDHTVMSKRRLRRLVEEGFVSGWDDPRMPTIAGQRRRGVRPDAIRAFARALGVSKVDGRVDLSQYEYAIRDDLNRVAPRVMAVARPLRMVIENLPAGDQPWVDAPYWPHDVTPPAEAPRTRRLPIGREVWIERDDFAEEPPKGWRRLSPGVEVRLRHGYVVRCTGVDRDEKGEVTGLRAEADLATLGAEPEGRKVRGVIHWVAVDHALPVHFNLYDRLFSDSAPDAAEDLATIINPESLVVTEGFTEPALAEHEPEARLQFERLGYFWQDPEDSSDEALVFNRIVTLKDTWARKTSADTHETAAPATKARVVTDRDPTAQLTDEQLARNERLLEMGIGEEEAPVIAAADDLASLLDRMTGADVPARVAAILIVHDLRPALGDRPAAEVLALDDEFVAVVGMQAAGRITRSAAREVVEALVADGGTAEEIVAERNLAAVRDADALLPIIDEVLSAHPDEVARYRSGEQRLLGFLMGQTMRNAPKGADAGRVRQLLADRLTG